MNAKWIWENTSPGKDEYAIFTTQFECNTLENLLFSVSADSRYEAFLNGECVGFGQYADFPHYKVADKLSLDKFAIQGINSLVIRVWYYGEGSLGYIVGKAGLWFEIKEGEKLLACSSDETLCAKDIHYQSGRCKKITGQLGYGFCYNAASSEKLFFHKAVLTGYETELHPRPVEPLEVLPVRPGKILRDDGGTILLDLGREEVGLLTFELESEVEQRITIAWGEHVVDGGVRQKIGGRDFSVEYVAHTGINRYTNRMRRFGARYLEFRSEKGIGSLSAGLLPVMYPLQELPFDAGDSTRQAIYDVSVRTLRLCMHEHYEDCPWREQALYAMDSRNQMLAGYYAFGETKFPRANLALIAKDKRDDGLLSITAPCGDDLAIPSFSLHWFTEMREYWQFTHDRSLMEECWEKLCSVLQVFLNREENGIIMAFTSTQHWNFYEWAPGLEGALRKESVASTDILLNSLVILALESMQLMSRETGLPLPWDGETLLRLIRENSYKRFVKARGNIPRDFEDTIQSSQLGISLAILSEIVTGEEANMLANLLKKNPTETGLTAITLSMKCFLYDALLKVNTEECREFILEDIRRVYSKMLDAGATSFWETEKGESDFDNAGSLCHGWSAMPVYYYHILLK